MNYSESVWARVTPETKQALQYLAETQSRKLSALVRMILEEYVEESRLYMEKGEVEYDC